MVATAGSFATVELIALKHERTPMDTLSQNLQWLLCRTKVRWIISAVSYFGLVMWFFDHIWRKYGR